MGLWMVQFVIAYIDLLRTVLIVKDPTKRVETVALGRLPTIQTYALVRLGIIAFRLKFNTSP